MKFGSAIKAALHITIPTAKSAFECARRLDVETPIIDQIYAILYERKPLLLAMQELLGRDPKAERL